MNHLKSFLALAISAFTYLNSSAQSVLTYSTPGTYTLPIPANRTIELKIEVWGAGGGGEYGGNATNSGGAGGGGGAYSTRTSTITSNTGGFDYTIIVGSGGQGASNTLAATDGGNSSVSDDNGVFIAANGGAAAGGTNNFAGSGGAASTGNANIVSYAGGNGGTAIMGNFNGAGGGAGASTTLAGGFGNSPDADAGGAGGMSTDGGLGGNGGTTEILGNPPVLPQNGLAPGGGGGGSQYGPNTIGAIGGNGKVVITIISGLPVNFGAINATFIKNNLKVNFNTLSESNNKEFNIQISENGIDFHSIATIKSKHGSGSFGGATNYEVNIDASGKVVLGISLLGLLGLGLPHIRKKHKLFMLLAVGIGIFIASCTKSDAPIQSLEGDKYLRIQQVDIDGNTSYSKVVKIVKS